MTLNQRLKGQSVRLIRLLAITMVALLAIPLLIADDGDEAWKQVQDLNRPIPVPEEWRIRTPSDAEIEKHNARNGVRAGEAAVKARDFYTRFPSHEKSAVARSLELPLLQIAVQLGVTNLQKSRDDLEAAFLKDPKTSSADRFALRLKQVQRTANSVAGDDAEKLFLEYEKGVRKLKDEFPQNAQVDEFMLQVASRLEHDKAAPLAREVLENSQSAEVKEAAQAILRQASLVGKPINLKFNAVDGRKVDLALLKGKVVLVGFWATWCAKCVADMPSMRTFYQETKAKGFEMVGISLDEDQDAMKKLISKEKITWPQYFDGQDNKFAKQFQVESLPTVWLVDKKGNLRYLKGNYGMKAKVEALLAEKS